MSKFLILVDHGCLSSNTCIDVYATSTWETYTIGAIGAIIGYFISGIPGSIAVAFGGMLATSAFAPYTSTAEIDAYKYDSTSFFKTNKYVHKCYAHDLNGNRLYQGSKTWYETWAGL